MASDPLGQVQLRIGQSSGRSQYPVQAPINGVGRCCNKRSVLNSIMMTPCSIRLLTGHKGFSNCGLCSLLFGLLTVGRGFWISRLARLFEGLVGLLFCFEG